MTGHLKRKRSRVACMPCRERKRKCDGGNPCATCLDWGYECYHGALPSQQKKQQQQQQQQQQKNPAILPSSASPGKSSDTVYSVNTTTTATNNNHSSSSHHNDALASHRVGPDPHRITRSLEANSGAAFVRNLGLKVDSTNAPRLNLFGWNIGERRLPSGLGNGTAVSALPIVDIVSLEGMKTLAGVYFAKVDPCYGFLDPRQFYERLDERWRSPLSSGVYDSVLAGVGALGSLFSRRIIDVTELLLVESARSILEVNNRCGMPCFDTATGWTLRVVYMRMTASPHSAWIASATLMHLVEALGLHLESAGETVLSRRVHCSNPDIRRRLVGVARHLNMWVSYDLGLSRVIFWNDQCLAPAARPGDYTTELLSLLPVSASLGPEKSPDDRDLESSLLRVLDGSHSQPPSVMAQCNLALCLLRRLLVMNASTSSAVKERVLALFRKALQCARSMAMNCCPWHHMANVPFQIIGVLLDMDTRTSLALLPEAMQTLRFVASTYDTDTMREAYSTACLLVRLYQRRRQEDVDMLSGLVSSHHQPDMEAPVEPAAASREEISWLEDLVAEMPSLQGINLYETLDDDLMNLFPTNL
ncbi:Zn(II)2Cys6 transcription factor [Aspergillus melleus]|uniref:Zn(II)2Cys6 transcription factor n=1 Tax=Aspergillus melleus TaxID=138277 RepID=UPI001E8CDFF1|nr:uncharacterized protein LDX57_003644 [Aspergillus melleus]KAH8425903.1 hypothetical protein LDX57_003644 [Aspergillus melleus]